MNVVTRCEPIEPILAKLVLLTRLKHLAVRVAFRRLEEVADSAYVKHNEQGVGRDGLALLCPKDIVRVRVIVLCGVVL